MTLSINILTQGAVTDGQTDNSAIFQKAINQIIAAGGGVLYVPAGTYALHSQITATCDQQQHISIHGDGRYTSVLRFMQGSQLGIAFTSTSLQANHLPNFEVHDIGLVTTQLNAGTALDFKYATDQNIENTVNVHDVRITQDLFSGPLGYWSKGISCTNARNGRIRNMHFYGERDAPADQQTQSAIHLQAQCTSFVISDCLILESKTGILAEGCTEGVYVHNTDIVGVQKGIVHTADQGSEPQLTVTDSHINASVMCIHSVNIQQGVVANCLLYANSWFDGANYPNWTGIRYEGEFNAYNKVIGCTFSKEDQRHGDQTVGIEIASGNSMIISANQFFGPGDNHLTWGVLVQPGVYNIKIADDNCYTNVTNPSSLQAAPRVEKKWWQRLFNL